MEKLVYVIAGAGIDAPTAHAAVTQQVVPEMLSLGARPVALSVTDRQMHTRYLHGANLSGAAETSEPTVAAVMELWIDCVDDHEAVSRTFAGAGLDAAGYLVTESIPVVQPRTWDWADPAPGVSLVTTIDRPAHLDEEAFFLHWTRVHSPMALNWHPLVGYVRNHVVRSLSPEAPSCAGIVSESYGELDDLLVPERFLGAGDDGTTLEERTAAMVDDIRAFLDLDRCFPFVMRQYRLGEG